MPVQRRHCFRTGPSPANEGHGIMSLPFVHAADIAGESIIGLADDRHGPGVVVQKSGVLPDHPLYRGVVGDTHGMGVGQADGAGEIARVVDPVGAGQFAVAVQVVVPGPGGAQIVLLPRGGSQWPRYGTGPGRRQRVRSRLIVEKPPVRGDVGDGIVAAGYPAQGQSQFPGARF